MVRTALYHNLTASMTSYGLGCNILQVSVCGSAIFTTFWAITLATGMLES